MYRGKPVRVTVDGRVMIDSDFFWKMNPNYSRPRADLAEMSRDRVVRLGGPPPLPPQSSRNIIQGEDVEPAELTEDDLLICCPTVLGFSYNKKIWGEYYPLSE
jgi:hypothetical protein